MMMIVFHRFLFSKKPKFLYELTYIKHQPREPYAIHKKQKYQGINKTNFNIKNFRYRDNNLALRNNL